MDFFAPAVKHFFFFHFIAFLTWNSDAEWRREESHEERRRKGALATQRRSSSLIVSLSLSLPLPSPLSCLLWREKGREEGGGVRTTAAAAAAAAPTAAEEERGKDESARYLVCLSLSLAARRIRRENGGDL